MTAANWIFLAVVVLAFGFFSLNVQRLVQYMQMVHDGHVQLGSQFEILKEGLVVEGRINVVVEGRVVGDRHSPRIVAKWRAR